MPRYDLTTGDRKRLTEYGKILGGYEFFKAEKESLGIRIALEVKEK